MLDHVSSLSGPEYHVNSGRDILVDLAQQNALDPNPTVAPGGGTFAKISKVCGQLARAPKSSLNELVSSLVSTGKLLHLFTDDAHTALLTPDSRSGDQFAAVESRLVAIHGCVTEYVCKACTARSQLTQAVLFKTMSNVVISCEVCGTSGCMAASASDNGSFVPDVFNAQQNAQRALDLAQADARAPIDILLVVGASAGVSHEWASIATVLSLAATKTIVLDRDLHVPSGISPSSSIELVQIDNEQLVEQWKVAHAEASDVDQAMLNGFSDLTLADSSSAAESIEEKSRSQSQISSSAGGGESSQTRKGAKGLKGRNREKASLNHLLNFSLPVRLPPPPAALRPRRRVAESTVTERQAELNRVTFINANFRFVLKPMFCLNFMPIATRADMQLDWAWIERVIIPVAGETVACPICLSPPVAARVAKCGHVFCYSCALRYLSFESERGMVPKKCPICWAMIAGDDLLPVHFWEAQYHTSTADKTADAGPHSQQSVARLISGAHITMRLMKRPHEMNICLPRTALSRVYSKELAEHSAEVAAGTASGQLSLECRNFPWTFTESALPFAKFILASHDYNRTQYSRELEELGREMAEETSDSMSRMYFEWAISSVETLLKDAQSPSASDRRIEARAMSEQGYHMNGDNAAIDELTETARSAEDSEKHPERFYYFYQADDGQHIYLHPLDIRILAQEHGGFDKLPDTVSIEVKHAVESTITDEVRKRFRFLQHLSLRCDVVFIESDLKGLVSVKNMDSYRTQLQQREKQHAARARAARLDEARSERIAETAAMMANSGSIQYRNEWSRDGNSRYDDAALSIFNTIPDDSSFPSLDSGPMDSPGGQTPRSADPHSRPRALWPRQPLSGSVHTTSVGDIYDGFWDEFERAAAGAASLRDEHDEDDEAAAHDHEHEHDHYTEDFSVLAKDTDPRAVQADTHTSKSRKGKKNLTLVLSGSSARRRR
ncbi:hypothetical protein GGI16_000593 [Coemansia sp. S142-1]|nr:hypothetical protein GGI16_000593 [Coemansia sp. S142-1]